MRKCAESWESVLKVEKVIENAPEVEFSWKSVLPVHIQLFSAYTISWLLIAHILEVTLGKIYFGILMPETIVLCAHHKSNTFCQNFGSYIWQN